MSMDEDQLSNVIIGAAIEMHRALGPGLLESTYEGCLARELALRKVPFERQKAIPVIYKGEEIDCGFRIDLLVDQKVIVELKAVDRLVQIHQAQVLTYLKLTGCKLALLLNFNVLLMKTGIRRVANDL
jgi:GxxExxY protein